MTDDRIRLDKSHVLYQEHTIGYSRARRKVVLKAGATVDASTAKKLGVTKTSSKATATESDTKDDPAPPTPSGDDLAAGVVKKDGGWYELPDGSKVQGEEAAHQAYAEYLELQGKEG